MRFSQAVWMSISVPVLIVGWAFAVMGVYFLAGSFIGFDTGEENASLAAIWAFLVSFGAVSISGLLAARAQFAEKSYVRKFYAYSIGGAAVLFLGYTVIGLLAGLLGWWV